MRLRLSTLALSRRSKAQSSTLAHHSTDSKLLTGIEIGYGWKQPLRRASIAVYVAKICVACRGDWLGSGEDRRTELDSCPFIYQVELHM